MPPAPSTPAATPAPKGAAVPPAAPAATPPAQLLTQAQRDQLVAPIALYPDPLLAQISNGLDLSARSGRGPRAGSTLRRTRR